MTIATVALAQILPKALS